MQGAPIPIGGQSTLNHPTLFDFDTDDGAVTLGSVSRVATTRTKTIARKDANPYIAILGNELQRVTLRGRLAMVNWRSNTTRVLAREGPFYPLEIWRQQRRKVNIASGLTYWAYAGNDWVIKSIGEDAPDLYVNAPVIMDWTIILER